MVIKYDAFEHLCRSLFKKPTDLFAMLTAYFDDSGTSENNKVAAVAGYIGSVQLWERFNVRWATLLAEYKIEELHRNKLESLQGPFATWDSDKRTEFVQKANAIINNNTYAAIGCNVIKSDLADVLGDKLTPIDAYIWCAYLCILGVSRWCDRHNYKDSVQFVFEAGTAGHGQVDELFKRLYSNENLREQCHIGSWSFAGKSLLPLQAADNIAYEFYKLINGQIVENAKRPIRKSMQDLIRQSDLMYLRDCNKQFLNRWISESSEERSKLVEAGFLKA